MDERNQENPDLSKDVDPFDEGEEETLFPLLDEEPPPPIDKPVKRFRFLKWFAGMALLAAVFFLGFFSRPDMLDQTLENVKEWTHLAIERAKPMREKVTGKVTEFIETKMPGKEKPAPAAGTEPTKGEKPKSKRKIKFWQSPMNPSYISDKPGKSPMGMDLVPVYEDEAGGTDGIRISPTVVQNIGVRTEKLKKRTLTREIRTVGRLTYDERFITHIHTKYEGWIEKLHVDFTGQEVEKDELLLEVYSPELVSTQEELLLAMKYNESLKGSPFGEISRGAENLLESTRRRMELFDVPEHQIEALIRDKKITKTMHIHSPVRGFVIKKDALQGMYIKPGMSLYTIADLSNIWVLVDIYEYELPWLKMGQEAEMSLSYFPGKKFKGKVTYIDPFLEPKSRTIKVRLEFNNPDWKLKPDMYANVTLKSVIAKRAVAVPEEAVIHSGERNVVIVRTRSGGFESRDVTLGAQAKGYFQVLKGLKAGETVVLSSSFLLDSESKLREAISKLQNFKPKPEKMKMKHDKMPSKKPKKPGPSIHLKEDKPNETQMNMPLPSREPAEEKQSGHTQAIPDK